MIYINLHPGSETSNVILAEYLPIQEYIRNVDWLCWFGRRQLGISDDLDKHRTYCFIQRMEEYGVEVLVRNERSDKEWRHPEYEPKTHEELVEIECEMTEISFKHYSQERQHILEGIQRDEEFIVKLKENKEDSDFFENSLKSTKEQLKNLEMKEKSGYQI